jgi:hypothetical protein
MLARKKKEKGLGLGFLLIYLVLRFWLIVEERKGLGFGVFVP